MNTLDTSPYYITTAIDYVNAAPHLGHAYEKIASDVIARFYRLFGRDVRFLTGTDEHGTKVAKTAEEKGLDPKVYTDRMSEKFKDTWAYLNLTYDQFIRTTDPEHYDVVNHLWETMLAKGDIYKASYTGHYCPGCENFLLERDINEAGECQIHLKKPDAVQEENYFFKLSRYKDQLKTLIQGHGFIQPEFRKTEILNMLEELEDISVSRPTESVSWGIPVPNDPSQTIYVWIDALSNYITGAGYRQDDALFKKFWPADCHMIGKDILRFHAIYWPAMLMSAEIELPKSVYAHGFINLNDAKISKSIGNVISPQDLGKRFELPHSDPIRYYLMTVTTFGQDGNFTEDDFKNRINADLANNLGNLVNRSLNMTKKYFDGQIPTLNDIDLTTLYQPDTAYLSELTANYKKLSAEERKHWKDGYEFPSARENPLFLTSQLRGVEGYLPSKPWEQFSDDVRFKYHCFDFEFALFTTFSHLINPVNQFIDTMAPWALAKEGLTDPKQKEKLARVLYSVLERIRQVAILVYPVIPIMAQNIFEQLGYVVDNTDGKQLTLNGKCLQWNTLYEPLPFGQVIHLSGPLLPRLDSEIVGALGKKK